MRRYCVIWVLIALFWLATTVYGAERHHIEQRPENSYIAIFVHGFTGDYLKTWGKLPELLQADPSLYEYDFLFWGYPSRLFRKNEDVGTTGKHLKTEIDYLSKPYNKIVLIGHSMGGLVIRSYIVQALIDGKGKDLKHIADVMLFGVPNEGDLKAQFVPQWVNDQIADLGIASKFITEVRKYWIQRVTAAPHNDDFYQKIPTVAIAGYQDQFVSQQNVESFFHDTAMTDGDHRSMVKPETTVHLTYRIIHHRLIDAVNKPHRLIEAHRRDFQQHEQADLLRKEQQPATTNSSPASEQPALETPPALVTLSVPQRPGQSKADIQEKSPAKKEPPVATNPPVSTAQDVESEQVLPDLASGKATTTLAPERPTIREKSAAEIITNLKGITPSYLFHKKVEELYLGRWTREPGWQVTVSDLPSKISGELWHCSFSEVGSNTLVWASTVKDVSMLRRGDSVTVSGRISRVSQLKSISLEEAIVHGDNVP
jgi:pimeloyl-ACP methyl ester carboxylesterase